MPRAGALTTIGLLFAAATMLASPASAQVPCDGSTVLGGLIRSVDDGVGLLSVCESDPDPDPTPTPTPDPDPTTRPERTPRATTSGSSGSPVPPVAEPVATSRPDPTPRRSAAGDPIVPVESPDTEPDLIAAGWSGTEMAGAIGAVLGAMFFGVLLGVRRGRVLEHARADERLEAVLDLLPDGVAIVDRDGTISAANGAARALMVADPIGRPGWAAVDGRMESGEPVAAWLRANERATDTARAGRDNVPIAISIAPVSGNGAVLVLRDLRPLRSVERMKREFLSNVGHELRTPLTSALGFARMLRTRALAPEQAETFIGAIVDACERLDRVIDLLIDVATLEGGAKDPTRDQVDLAELVRQTVHSWADRSPTHVFAEDLPARLPKLAGNRGVLRHALNELLDNAVKFSPGGGVVTVAVSLDGTGTDRTLRLSVSDQGVGIDAAALERLFEDFEQGDGSETRSFGGLGLGLGFVRRVAALHGGRMMVSSEPQHGSTFTMAVPAPVRSRARA